ncbi:hypothetical protein LINGRAHAP2_LOCUS21946 [Linum grandiflorum]
MLLYHGWLLFTILNHPTRTVIGINSQSRHQWVHTLMTVIPIFSLLSMDFPSLFMQDPLKNGVLAVQTLRNNIMASTLLATTAITLSSLISVFVSSKSNSTNSAQQLVYGNKTPFLSSIKYFSILLCFLVAFLCNVQSIRYYAHVSFLATIPSSSSSKDSIEYVARHLNRGSFFWSLGLRAYYVSFPLFLWVFGPIPMFVCCWMMCFTLYFLDTTTSFTRLLHSHSVKARTDLADAESV